MSRSARVRTARGEGMEETPALAAIKTYRYLRLALVGLVVMAVVFTALGAWRIGRSIR